MRIFIFRPHREGRSTFRGFIRFLTCIDIRVFLGEFAAVVIGGLWLSTYVQLENLRSGVISDARHDAQSLARLFLEHANRTIESTDQAAIYLRYRFGLLGAHLDLAKEIDNGLVPKGIFNLFSVVDKDGNVVLATKPFSTMNLSDREHIAVQRDSNQDSLFISKPVLGRVSERRSIQMTRKIVQTDGLCGGAVVVFMDPQYFTQLYHQIDIGQYGAISLFGRDGIICIRRLSHDDTMGQSRTGNPFFNTIIAQENGLTQTRSSIDGRMRIYAFNKFNSYSLYVSVSIDPDERLAQYYEQRSRSMTVAAFITFAILLIVAVIVWMANQLVRSRQAALLANQAKSRFLSNMSHELPTPLNGILSYTQLILDEPQGASASEFAHIIHKSGMRLLALIESILELSALEGGRWTSPITMSI